MQGRVLFWVAAASVAIAVPAGAAEVVVTPNDVSTAAGSWHPANERSGATSAITGANPDQQGGTGSLEQTLPAPTSPSPKTDFQIFSADTTFVAGEGLKAAGGFGPLADLDALAFDWYRDSASTAPAHLTPALRLYVWDPDAGGPHGTSYLFVWEGVYNGYPVGGPPTPPTDAWQTQDILDDNFWRIPQYVNGAFAGIGSCAGGAAGGPSNPAECFVFNRSLGDWALGPDSVVLGIEVGLGSGWAGTYHSFADLVTIGFDGNDPTVWNFEFPETLACEGFGPPANRDLVARGDRVVPLKLVVRDANGTVLTPADIAPPVVRATRTDVPSIAATPVAVGQGDGDAFEFGGGQWQYNLRPSAFGANGTYLVEAASGDPGAYTLDPTCAVTIEVR